MLKITRKSKILFFISLTVILVVSSLIQQKMNETEQHKAFVDNIGVPTSDEETKFIEQFYIDLGKILNDYAIIDRSSSFTKIDAGITDKPTEVRFMTLDLLVAACDTNQPYDSKKNFLDMNASMGTSSFSDYLYSRDWDRAFWSDLQYLYKEKYFGIIECTSIQWPEVEKGEDFYYTGTISASVSIYNLSTLTCESVSQVYAENGENVEIKSFLKVEAQQKKLNEDLLKQFRKAIEKSMKSSLGIK